MSIKIITSTSKSSSFYYVSESVKRILSNLEIDIISFKEVSGYIPSSIFIHSTLLGIDTRISADIWWSDEPMLIPNRPSKYFDIKDRFKYFIAVSNYYKDHVEKYFGFKVDDIIYRPYNPIAGGFYCYYQLKEYDIICIGIDDYSKRKNIHLVESVVLENPNIKAVFITNRFIPKRSNIAMFNSGSVDEYTKFRLISESKFLVFPSSCESFGLPVLEAMAVGTIPIYPDTPPFTEFAEGIKIKDCTKKETYRYGCKVIMYEINKDELHDTIKYALNLSANEYEDLSAKCKEKAVEVNREIRDKLAKWIDKIKY